MGNANCRQVWYDVIRLWINTEIPCDVDCEDYSDDFINAIINNIWEFRKFWCSGNNLGLGIIAGLPYSFDGMIGSHNTFGVAALIQAMRVDIFLGFQSES